MPRKSLSLPEVLALFKELPSDNDSAASTDSDTDEDCIAKFTGKRKREVIRGLLLMGSKTSKRKSLSSKSIPAKTSKPYVPVDEHTENVKNISVKTEGGLYRCALCSTRKDVHRSQWLC
ncbi:hypothetical protein NPIL_313761 [Nephila pilipes]|uniref:Uncharacterized protein n=1 Tax=Nephila pilipes TaxID=299642 RepID=A0A8X6P854_NEPPI|nr:hypothetical protein NPIL_313761 [Nephila pilipes]